MQITRTRTKYYLLSVLGALVVAVGVLAVAPLAQAQVAPEPPSIDKECNPNPVQIGQQITCTIDLVAAPGTQAVIDPFTDTFPTGIRPSVAVFQFVLDGEPGGAFPCTVDSQTVNCNSDFMIANDASNPGGDIAGRFTVEATAEQCGTFQNTATATGFFLEPALGERFTVEDTEEITVEGCEVPTEPAPDQQPGGSPAPITQDGEQESEAGEIDQSFEVS